MSTIDLGAESLERRYHALRPKLEPLGQELLDRLFREYKHYGEESWFDRHLQFLEAEFSPKSQEARQVKMKALRAAALKRSRPRSSRGATTVTPAARATRGTSPAAHPASSETSVTPAPSLP